MIKTKLSTLAPLAMAAPLSYEVFVVGDASKALRHAGSRRSPGGRFVTRLSRLPG